MENKKYKTSKTTIKLETDDVSGQHSTRHR